MENPAASASGLTRADWLRTLAVVALFALPVWAVLLVLLAVQAATAIGTLFEAIGGHAAATPWWLTDTGTTVFVAVLLLAQLGATYAVAVRLAPPERRRRTRLVAGILAVCAVPLPVVLGALVDHAASAEEARLSAEEARADDAARGAEPASDGER